MSTRARVGPGTCGIAMVFLLSVYGLSTIVRGAESQSEPLARQLSAVMIQQNLTAYAVRDPRTPVFVQDLKADGLHASAPDTADIVYERVVTQLVFDGRPAAHHLSAAKYADEFSAADALYKRLLSTLLDALGHNVTAPGR